jgi:hypothetical protein
MGQREDPITKESHRMAVMVVIGDIVASREIAERADVQHQLKAALNRLNRKRKALLLSPYTITLGDEFQMVRRSSEGMFEDAVDIMASIAPVEVRFSFAAGTLTTPLNRQYAIGMDGPAFHAAREGMTNLKRKKLIWGIAGLSTPDELPTHSIDLVSHLMSRWKPSQIRILLRLIQTQPILAIARELGVSDKTVYKAIDNGGHRKILPLLVDITTRYQIELEKP